jgi:hypothetical protein
MITFPHIGYIGRLGNQMFQYACLLSLSNKLCDECVLNSTNLDIFKCFDIITKISSYYNYAASAPNGLVILGVDNPYSIRVTPETYINLLKTNFDEDFFNKNHRNKSIVGFFQNYKYFQDIDSLLRKNFKFKRHIYKISKNYIDSIFPETSAISLHIRRTDYLESSVLNNLTLEYYESALSHFNNKTPVIIFSDDIEWCKQQPLFNSNRFVVSESENPYIDLCLMSLCNYHIIANSSFSWWGSWLAKSKKTICPKNWFSPNFSYLDSEGLRLSNWISI